MKGVDSPSRQLLKILKVHMQQLAHACKQGIEKTHTLLKITQGREFAHKPLNVRFCEFVTLQLRLSEEDKKEARDETVIVDTSVYEIFSSLLTRILPRRCFNG